MERKKEIAKLVNVLRQTARMAQQAGWTGDDDEAAAFCTQQYNRVLARLTELDGDAVTIFEPLSAGVSLTVVAVACRQLAAYYEDEVRPLHGWGRVYGAAFDSESFKDFWRKSARDIEDLGEFIRENVEAWAKRHEHGHEDEADIEDIVEEEDADEED
jgi:hypothetical protein